jgi:hypothetical protein
MKKKHAQTIRKITESVGEVTTETTEFMPISGSDLLLTGYGKQKDAHRIRPEGEYEIPVPVTIYHSAKKILKRALKKNGENGLVDFVRKVYDERVG